MHLRWTSAAFALAALLAIAAPRPAQAQAVPWPNGSFTSARQVTLTSGTQAIPVGSVVSVTIDHAALVTAGFVQADGDDLRLAYRSGGVVTEIPRALANGSAWNSAATKIMFKTQALIPASSSDAQYFLFYGNPAAVAPAAGGVPSARIYKVEQLAQQSIAVVASGLVDVPGTTLTFTPGDATETWVIFASGVLRSDSNKDLSSEMALMINGTQVDNWGQRNVTPSTPNGSGFLVFHRITGTTAPQTVKLQFQTWVGTTFASSLRVVAVLLPQGSDFQFVDDPALVNLPKNTVNGVVSTMTFTPSSPGDYFVFGKTTQIDPGGGTAQSWMQDDAGVAHPDAPAGVHYSNPGNANAEMATAFRRTLTAGSKTFTLRGTAGGNNGSNYFYRRMMAFRADGFEAQDYVESLGLSTSTGLGLGFISKASLTTAAPPAPRDYLVVQIERLSGTNDKDLQKSGDLRDGGATILRTDHHIDKFGDANGYHSMAAVANVKTTAAAVTYENGFQSSDTSRVVECADSTIMALRYLEPTVSQRPVVRDVTSSAADGVYKAGAVLPIQIVFSEVVTVTGAPQLSLATGAVLTYASGSGTNTLTFTYTVAPGQNSADLDTPGVGALALAGGTIRDLAGLDDDVLLPAPGTPGSLGANKNLVIDTFSPTAPGTPSGTPNPNNTGTFVVNWGPASDTGGTGVGTVTYRVERSFNGGGFSVVAPSVAGTSLGQTGLAEGLYRYRVQAFDLAGNGGLFSLDSSPVVVDLTAPFVNSILPTDPLSTNLATVHYTVNFSESVFGVDITDFTLITTGVTGASITNVTGSGQVWTVTIATGTGDGTIQLALVPNPSIQENAGNLLVGPFPSSQIYDIEKAPPSAVSIARLNFVQTNAASVGYLVTFDKNVTGVDATDFVVVMTGAVTGASVTSVTGSNKSWTVTVNTGSGDGGLQLNLVDDDSILGPSGIPLGGAGAGNGNLAGPAYVVDKSFPVVSSIVLAGATPTNAASVAFTVTFSESVVLVAATDFSVGMTGGVTGASVTSVTGTLNTRTVTVNTGTGSGTIQLSLVDGDTILDITGNPLGGSGLGNGNFSGQTYTIDKTAPTVSSIVRASANPTNAAGVTYTVTFSEAVSGVDAADFALVVTGVSGAALGPVSGSGTTWTVTVSTGTGDGTIQLTLSGSPGIQDLLGTALTAPFTTGEVYTIDKTAPSIAISGPSTPTTTTGPVSYTVTYTGASTVTLSVGDVVLNPTGTATGSIGVSGAGTASRTVTISAITGNGTLGISISAGTASDLASNLAPAAGPSATVAVTNSGTIALPTLLQVDTLTNPTLVGRPPAFSAQHNWTGATPSDAVSFRIQVSTDPTFATLTHWNSPASGTLLPGSVSVPAGSRSPQVRYWTGGQEGGGPTIPYLSWNQQYFWRVEFKDVLGDLSGFSSEAASFRMTSPSVVTSANGNGSPTDVGWRYVGFPIAVGKSIPASALLNTIGYAFKWEEPIRQWIQLTGADVLEGGRGYIAWAAPGTPLTLSIGEAAFGDQVLALSFTDLPAATGSELIENKPRNYFMGSHIIANPFNAPISWGNSLSSGDVVKTDLSKTYFKWDGTQYLTYNSDSESGAAGATIPPFQAFGVNVLTGASPTSLVIQEPAASSFFSAETLMAARSLRPADAWKLQLVATSGAALDTENYVGVHPSAQDAWDSRDAEEPGHGATTWVNLSFDHSDWPTRPHLYTHDFRKTRLNAGDEIVWTATLESNSGAAVTLSWPNFSQLPTSDWQYFIEDPAAGTSIDLSGAASMQIGPLTGPTTVLIRARRLTSAAGTLGIAATAGGPAPTSVAPGASAVAMLDVDVTAGGEAVTVGKWVVHHEGTGDPSKVQVSLYDGGTRLAGPSSFNGGGSVVWAGLGQTVGTGSPQIWEVVYDFAADATGTYRAALFAGEMEGVGNSSGLTITPSPTLIESSELTVTPGATAPVSSGSPTPGSGGRKGGGKCGLLGVECLGIAALLCLKRRFGGRQRAER